MKIYIAGPMSGIADHNFPAFDSAREALVHEGHTVVSPADLTRRYRLLELPLSDKERYARAMRIDITELMTCDAVYVLPGFRKSRGCKVELSIARVLAMPIISFSTRQEIK